MSEVNFSDLNLIENQNIFFRSASKVEEEQKVYLQSQEEKFP